MTGAIFNYPLILIFFALGFDFVGKVFAGDEEKYQVCQTDYSRCGIGLCADIYAFLL